MKSYPSFWDINIKMAMLQEEEDEQFLVKI